MVVSTSMSLELINAMLGKERATSELDICVQNIRRMRTIGGQNEALMASLREEALAKFAHYLVKIETEAAIVCRAIKGEGSIQPQRTPHDEETDQGIRDALQRYQGMSLKTIANDFGVSVDRVWALQEELGPKPTKAP
jgi:hypothetical protein